MKRSLVTFAIVANLVLVDAVVKELAAGLLKGSAAVSVISGFFDLAYVENRGCAWGMFQGQVWPLAIFGLVALVILVWKRRSVFGVGTMGRVAECLLYAGIVGNVIDRFCRGYVIDMFDFHWGAAYHFPCFNVADVCISTAAGLMILMSFVSPRRLRIAVTGGIACGKSLVADYLREAGVATIDADDIVHELLPDPEERRRLAAEVFADTAKRKALEARLHPQVKRRIDEFLREGRGGLRMAIVPLLFETGWNREYDKVICIASTSEHQLERMLKCRGYTREEALSRIAAQMPVAEKAAKSDYVIHNDDTSEKLREEVARLVKKLS